MADYATLKAAIQAVIYENGNQEITGSVMQATLLAMVNSLGANYQYAGIATPSTNPDNPDQNVFYLASTAGTYVNFGNIVLAENEVAILKYNGSWEKETSGFASAEKVSQLGQEVDTLRDEMDGKVTVVTDITSLFNSWTNDRYVIARSSSSSFGAPNNDSTQTMKSSGYINIQQYAGKKLLIAFAKNQNAQQAQLSAGICFYTGATSTTVISGVQFPQGALAPYELEITIPDNAKYLMTTYMKDDTVVGAFYAKVVEAVEKGTLQEQIDDLSEDMSGLETQFRTISDYRLDEYNLQANGTYGTNRFYLRGVIPVKQGEVYRLTSMDSPSYLRYAFTTSDKGDSGTAIPLVSGTSVETVAANGTDTIIVPDGAKFLMFNTRGSGGLYNFTLERVDKLVGEVTGLMDKTSNYAQVSSWMGNTAARATSAGLSSDLELPDYPTANKFGDKYTFGCKVSSFSGIKICKGYGIDYGAFFEIDGTNVKLYKGTNMTTPVATVAHGLTILTMLNVNINVTKEGAAVLTLQTLGGSFSHSFAGWGYDVRGVVAVKNDGSTVSDCVLTANNDNFKCPVWVFGASFESVGTNRWPGQLKAMGYFNFLLNAYPGRDSARAITDLELALQFGVPKFLYFAGSNDPQDNIFAENHTRIMALCKTYGITLIANLRADNKESDYSARRTTVLNSGCRYVNNYAALQDPSITWSEGTDTWYEGFQSSDGKHPTALGAASIAMQFLKDFPEIMQ